VLQPQHRFIYLMCARSFILTVALLHQVQGARLGSPKDKDKQGSGWAFQDADGHHAPPGHLAAPKKTDGYEHAWDSKASPQWKSQMPKSDGMPMPAAAGARTVLQPRKADDMEPETVAKYNANHKISSDSDTGGSADFQSTLEQDCHDSITLKDFMPKCLKHTKSLIADLDYNYGDAQLETILRNWCQSAKEFPHTRGTQKAIGFMNHQTCFAFADDLKNARFYELQSTSDKGYRKFCSDFYGHHGGFAAPAPPRVKEEPPKFSGSSWAGLSMVVASLVLCIA